MFDPFPTSTALPLMEVPSGMKTFLESRSVPSGEFTTMFAEISASLLYLASRPTKNAVSQLQWPGIVVVVGSAVVVLVDEDVELVVGFFVVDVVELVVVDVVVGCGAQPWTRKSTSSLWSVALFPVTIWTVYEPLAGRTIVQVPGNPVGNTL